MLPIRRGHARHRVRTDLSRLSVVNSTRELCIVLVAGVCATVLLVFAALTPPASIPVAPGAWALSADPSAGASARARLASALAAHRESFPLAKNKPPPRRIILLKTHKTASTTVGGVLFRWGARHAKKMCCAKPHTQTLPQLRKLIEARSGPFDVFLNHYGMHNHPPLGHFPEILRSLQRLVPGAAVVTIVRKPVEHFASHFHFYVEGTRRYRNAVAAADAELSGPAALAAWALAGAQRDPLAEDFGVRGTSEAERLLDQTLGPALDGAPGGMVLLQDRLAESLVLLRRRMGWELADVLHPRPAYSSRAPGSFLRWDGRRTTPTPRADAMPEPVRRRIEALTRVDALIYRWAEERFDRAVAQQARAPDGLAGFRREVDALKRANAIIAEEVCAGTPPTPRAEPPPALCEWYGWTDSDYEKRLDEPWPGDAWPGDAWPGDVVR